MPRKDTVSVGVHAAYRFNLYEAFDAGSLNSLERNVARVIEGSEHVLWWASVLSRCFAAMMSRHEKTWNLAGGIGWSSGGSS
jgi:hypothetical protein